MVFVACGLNHKTAPLPMREKVAVPTAMHDSLLHSLLDLPQINEAALLSTCNRTEIYCDTNDTQIVSNWLADTHQLAHDTLLPYFYVHEGHQGLKHTLRVASGLDSMMVGEPQILGQMKQAYQQALQIGSIKAQLRPVFEYVFKASKRVRTLSGVGANPVSVAYAAVQLVGQLFPNFSALNVLIIGSGETSSLVAKYLHQQGVKDFMVASRSIENARKLANSFTGSTIPISDIQQNLPMADVVISATACPLPFINKNLVEHTLKVRNNKPMFLLDLAVPRDIEADVAELEHVHLYNIDDLQLKIEAGLNERRHAALQAEQLIESELDNYIRWHRSLQANELICSYRESMQKLAQQEVQRASNKLAAGKNQQEVLLEFSDRLVNKLVHNPTVGLRKIAWDGQKDLLALAKYLFANTLSETTKHFNPTANKPTPYEEIS